MKKWLNSIRLIAVLGIIIAVTVDLTPSKRVLLSANGGLANVSCSAGICTFTGADGSTQLVVGTTSSAVDFLNIVGGISGAGGSIIAKSGTDSNVPVNITSKGNANVNFANSGSGQLAQAVDPGGAVSTNGQVQITPSTSSGPTKVGNATYGINLDCGTNFVCQAGGNSFFTTLAKSGTPSAVTGTATETILATIPIPANSLGANGQLRIRTYWIITSSANTKTLNVRLGTTGTSSTQISTSPITTFNSPMITVDTQNLNATNSQNSFSEGSRGTDGLVTTQWHTSAADMTGSQNIYITGTLGLTSETITLTGYSVETVH